MENLRDHTVTDARSPALLSALVGAPLPEGSVLGGRYRILRFVAAGGMGEVYEADDQLLGDPVAVKLLRADLVRKPGAQARFADEIRLARRVTHPNVCRVFDVGVDGDRVFYTMELHRCGTLKSEFQKRGRYSVDEIRPIVRQILAGLTAAHDASVVHADLKPSNVLLDQNGRAIITDFGLAVPCCATLGCPCDMAHLVGTPAYMAPEQVTGGMVLDGTDLFSLGVILFEMLTGSLPWRGETLEALANARLAGDVPSPRDLQRDIDPVWDDVIRHCLQRDREQRPENAARVAARLAL